ncbi:MAG: plasmid mobilization relaxosome protein MobC [Bacilli bacterium]
MRKRTKGVLIRLTDDEFYDLTNRAQKCGISRERYIRLMVLGQEMPRPLLPIEFHEIIKQLRAIGNNLNQIAMVENITCAIEMKKYE